MGPTVAIATGTEDGWLQPGRLSLNQIVFENGV